MAVQAIQADEGRLRARKWVEGSSCKIQDKNSVTENTLPLLSKGALTNWSSQRSHEADRY